MDVLGSTVGVADREGVGAASGAVLGVGIGSAEGAVVDRDDVGLGDGT